MLFYVAKIEIPLKITYLEIICSLHLLVQITFLSKKHLSRKLIVKENNLDDCIQISQFRLHFTFSEINAQKHTINYSLMSRRCLVQSISFQFCNSAGFPFYIMRILYSINEVTSANHFIFMLFFLFASIVKDVKWLTFQTLL